MFGKNNNNNNAAETLHQCLSSRQGKLSASIHTSTVQYLSEENVRQTHTFINTRRRSERRRDGGSPKEGVEGGGERGKKGQRKTEVGRDGEVRGRGRAGRGENK